jgi:tRNA U55 pseudouridine synthase TruB
MHTVYKPIGKTPLEIVNEFKIKNNLDPIITVAYSGRLDPMAHGQLVLLTGDQVKKSAEYDKKNKRYVFKIIIGISTDTTDILGLLDGISNINNINNEDIDNIKRVAKEFDQSIYEQQYHMFSSMTVNICNTNSKTNKKAPLWKIFSDPTIDKTNIIIPTKRVNIFSLEQTNEYIMSIIELKELIDNNLGLITDTTKFRLPEIKTRWNDYFNNTFIDTTDTKFTVLEFVATVSSGTYIRQLVKDIGIKCNIPIIVIDIFRDTVFL